MRKLFLLSLLSLAVGLGSCKKDEPDPEPTLEGRWTPETAIVYQYDATGTLTRQDVRPRYQNIYTVITKDSIINRALDTNMRFTTSGSITRQGNSLTLSAVFEYNVLIQKLTDHALVLRFKDLRIVPGTPYSVSETTYSR